MSAESRSHRRLPLRPIAAAVIATLLVSSVAVAGDREIKKDVDAALEGIEKAARDLIRKKGIDWRAVRKEMRKAAGDAETVQDEFVVLLRTLARLNDGHARVTPADGVEVSWPEQGKRKGPGLFWCRDADGNVLIKNAWGDAAKSGVRPGMRVVEVDGEKVEDWISTRMTELRDLRSFSTDHQAEFNLFHWGLAGPEGELVALELRDDKGKRKKARVPFTSRSTVPWGPAVFPEGLERVGRQAYGKLASGYGYIHLRDVPGELPTQLDTMLAALGDVPGLVLDCRANGGGGCDHEAVFGRFVPPGKKLSFAKTYESAGATPYTGPMIVIVDAGVRSAGETVSGMFKEDGRAYMIGPEPTAGMSSGKTTVELPSGRFSVYFSTRSNMGRFNGGDGIEGLGVAPHEVVAYDAETLAADADPLIARAEALLAEFPQDSVPYDPEKHAK